MGWYEFLSEVLRFQILEVGDHAVTVQRVLLFVIVLVITSFMARAVRTLMSQRWLTRMEPAPRYVLARILQYVVWLIGFVIALEALGFSLTTLTVVAGALGVGIGFGLQSVVGNFVSGVVLLFEQPIRIHDRVTVESVEGNVVGINFRSTTIVTNDNISIIVPNSQFINNSVINWSHGDPKVRIHVPVGVAYGSDVALVTETLLAIARETEGVLERPEPEVRFKEFGDSSLDFELLVWTDKAPLHLQLKSRLNYGIDAAFRRNGIQIPFPQRDVHLKSEPDLSSAV